MNDASAVRQRRVAVIVAFAIRMAPCIRLELSKSTVH